MKKTININLSGMAFNIEDDAYDKLKGYLDAVNKVLGNSDEAKETLNDIEARMAELFVPVTREGQTSISASDVDDLIKILGEPEVYAPEGSEEAKVKEETRGKKEPFVAPVIKKLHRDPYSRVLGGVCSGLGAYFRVDPIVFRLLFILGLFYGITIIPYIILWIIMPKAVTIEQRNQMYGGEPPFSRTKAGPATYSAATSGTNRVLRIIAICIGIVIVVVSFFILIGLTLAILFSSSAVGLIPEAAYFRDLFGMLIADGQLNLISLGLLLTIGIPVLMLLYLGLHLIFQFRSGGKIIGTLSLLFWLAGLGILIFGMAATGLDFRHKETVEDLFFPEPIDGDTLYLRAGEGYYEGYKEYIHFNNIKARLENDEVVLYGRPRIVVEEHAGNFSVTVEKTAYGATIEKAQKNASMLNYSLIQDDSTLQLDKVFTIPKDSKIRDQKVVVRIRLAEGMVVDIDPSLSKFIRWSVN